MWLSPLALRFPLIHFQPFRVTVPALEGHRLNRTLSRATPEGRTEVQEVDFKQNMGKNRNNLTSIKIGNGIQMGTFLKKCYFEVRGFFFGGVTITEKSRQFWMRVAYPPLPSSLMEELKPLT